jgi:hypothetical protein
MYGLKWIDELRWLYNAFIFCVHYLCLIGRVYVFYVGHVDKSCLYETLFHCNILCTHHHHHEIRRFHNLKKLEKIKMYMHPNFVIVDVKKMFVSISK